MSEYSSGGITPLSTGGAFWSTGKKNSRRSALGATAIVVLLGLISWMVWMSPTDNVVRKVVGDVVQPIATNMALKNDRADLLTQLVSSKSQLTDQSVEIAELKKQLAQADGKSESLASKLSSAMAGQSKVEGQVASLKDQMASSTAGGTSGASETPTLSGGGSSPTTADTPSGASGGSTETPPTPSDPTGPVTLPAHKLTEITAASSKFFGLYTQQSPFNWAENDNVATAVGESPNLSGYFQGWDSDFRSDAVNRAWAKGQVPFLTWESQPMLSGNNATEQSKYKLSNIIEGDFDSYLTKYAKDIAANGQPLAIRLDQEFNANWYPWGEGANGNAKGEFASMWQHVHKIFADNGAGKYVAWVWAPNRVNNLNGAGQQDLSYLKGYWPGDDQVDIVGLSGYLRPPYSSSETYSFEHTFTKTLGQLREVAPGKPIILAEIGASENGGQKAKWITDLFANLDDPANADIIGFSWFNHTITSTTSGVQYTNDWRLNSSKASTQAFTTGLDTVLDDYKLTPAD